MKIISCIVTLLLLTSCSNQQDNNQNINIHLDDEIFELTSDHSIFELVNTDDISVIEFIEDNHYLYAIYTRPIFEASQDYETIIGMYDKQTSELTESKVIEGNLIRDSLEYNNTLYSIVFKVVHDGKHSIYSIFENNVSS